MVYLWSGKLLGNTCYIVSFNIENVHTMFLLTMLFISAIGRTLIPRYFRSIFEGGVTELYYNLKHPKESFHNTSITLDCDQCTMVTHHGKPMFTKVSITHYFVFFCYCWGGSSEILWKKEHKLCACS